MGCQVPRPGDLAGARLPRRGRKGAEEARTHGCGARVQHRFASTRANARHWYPGRATWPSFLPASRQQPRRWWLRATSCNACHMGQAAIRTRGALEEDCSSTVNYVLYRPGVRPIAEIVKTNPLAQDYVRWGLPGPGRWVTIYATTVPTESRVHRRRGYPPGHQSQRHRRRSEPQRRRPALAHPRPHPDLGALVGPPSARVVRCPPCPPARSTTC